jgi:sugar transferase EpsL
VPERSVQMISKRILDVAGSLAMLAIFWPVIVAVSLIIWLTMGTPVLFRQTRPGQYARLFTLLKFRTMVASQSAVIDTSTDVARLTRVGIVLRRFSLDELPQLWNVLIGEMSLVGPRPLLIEYLNHYTPEQAKRHLMKPGITGLAQIQGRNAISWEQKFFWDTWYVDHWSLYLDLRIILLTVGKVIRQEGIRQAGHATMEKFGAERR